MKGFIFGVLILSFAAMAQNDSMIMVKRSDVPTSVVKKYEMEQNVQNFGKLAGLGKEVGIAMREGLGAITEEAVKLSKTDVGKFTMFIIAFKVIGYPIIQLSIGLILIFIGTLFFIWYILTYCRNKYDTYTRTYRAYDKPSDGEGQYPIVEEKGIKALDDSNMMNNRIIGGIVTYMIYMALTMLVIFAHG